MIKIKMKFFYEITNGAIKTFIARKRLMLKFASSFFLRTLTLILLCLSLAIVSSAAHSEEPEFLKFGRSLDSEKSTLKSRDKTAYKEALAKFPDAQSCVVSVDGAEELQNLPLDQSKIDSLMELEVCVFRMAASLKNINLVKVWFENNGFRTNGPSIKPVEVMLYFGRSEPGFGLGVSIEGRKVHMNLGWLYMLGVDWLSVGIRFDNDERPIDVGSQLQRF